MTKILHRNMLCLSTMFFASIFSLQNSFLPVYAEGGNKRTNDNWGVNRRVVTRPGYAEVAGTVNMEFSIPTGVGPAGRITEWETHQNSPTYYLGGAGRYVNDQGGVARNVHVDAGLQYDLRNRRRYQDDPASSATTGWHCFLRNSNWETVGTDSAGYNTLKYWDPNAGMSTLWNTYQVGASTGITNAYLGYRIFEGDDANTGDNPATVTAANTLVEQRGWMSLTFDQLGIAGPTASSVAGRRTVYWTEDGPPTVTTSVQSGGAIYTNTVTLASIAGMAVADDIRLGEDGVAGTETKRVIAIDAATRVVTVNSNFTVSHPAGQVAIGFLLTKTTVQSAVAAGDTTITVASGLGLQIRDIIRVGAEVKRIAAINTNVLTVDSAFTASHAVGEIVTWEQLSKRAYANHPVAPWYGAQVFHPGGMGAWRVRRVLGITRRNPITEELDNSWLTCTFYNGQVRRVGEAIPHNWVAGDVTPEGQEETGYDARANPGPFPNNERDSVFDQRWPSDGRAGRRTPASRTIIEFPNLTVVRGGITVRGNDANIEGRNNTVPSQEATENTESRYTRETVHINLRRGTRPVAPPVRAVRPAPAGG